MLNTLKFNNSHTFMIKSVIDNNIKEYLKEILGFHHCKNCVTSL